MKNRVEIPGRPQKLVVCIAFFFVENRLAYLKQVTENLGELGDSVEVHVVTQTDAPDDLEKIKRTIEPKKFELFVDVPKLLGHPFLLPWCHFAIFRRAYEQNDVTHFLYLEDDILVAKTNILYWMRAREQLRPFGLIPSFLRFEVRDRDGVKFCSDITRPYWNPALPKVTTADGALFLNLPEPYQGMYFLDRELFGEHLQGRTSHPDFGSWPIREKSAQGVTFLNVPSGFKSRNVVAFDRNANQLDPACLIHHLPNNYANLKYNRFGRVPVSKVLNANLFSWMTYRFQHLLYRRTRWSRFQLGA